MPAADTLLRAILIDPSDDLARLAYADAMEEVGECKRAEFIRAQVELARVPEGCHCGEGPDPTGCGPCRARFSLWKKAEDTFRFDGFSWLALQESDPDHWECCDAVQPDHWGISFRMKSGWERSLTLHRGFVSVIRMPLYGFLRNALHLFSRHPVERVVLTGREPSPMSLIFWGWWHSWLEDVSTAINNYSLPARLWDLLDSFSDLYSRSDGQGWKWYATREDADAALSRAAVAHGRSLAGLPPLPSPSDQVVTCRQSPPPAP